MARTVKTVKPELVSRAHLVTLCFVAAIIVTGSAVRLTGSGLGCSRWPNCEPGGLVKASNWNQAVEQVNRLFTGAIAIPIIVGIVLSWLRSPRRRDLVVLSASLFGWLVGEAVLGGLVTLSHLNPAVVGAHFLLGIAGLIVAVVLHHRSREGSGLFVPTVSPRSIRLVRLSAVLGALTLALGTVVTGTGPHGGAERLADGTIAKVSRYHFALTSVARVHSVAVWATVAAVLYLVWRIRSGPDHRVLESRIEALLLVAFVQGAIGYLQFATKLPVPLVVAHIVGAVAATITMTRLVLATRAPEPTGDDQPPPRASRSSRSVTI